ncbi:MAG: hypothetical protein EXR92_01025 [Gemmatimonadetes bacterium]|nr:hypothetical protein [Gemmatimonadota bacterium]
MFSKKSILFASAVGVVAGALGFGLVRFALLPPVEHVHFHANWAVWLNGERVDFSADRYMEEVSACATDVEMTGPARVHLHENNPDVVHVHDDGVTWGHLLQNLGWAIGPDWILTDQFQLFKAGDGAHLTFIMGGMNVFPAYDRLIRPGDRLLISFGSEPVEELIGDRFPTVANNAPEYDVSFDPAGCSGQAPETLGERFRRAFWM